MQKWKCTRILLVTATVVFCASSMAFSGFQFKYNGSTVINIRDNGDCMFAAGFSNVSTTPVAANDLRIGNNGLKLWTHANSNTRAVDFAGTFTWNTTVPAAGLAIKNPGGLVVSSLGSTGDFSTSGTLYAPYPFVWNGDDPFHQPAPTTDYYGSGDVDLNGVFNATDVSLVASMVSGTRISNYRGDVDGNSAVDNSDVQMLQLFVNGGRQYLPAHWNSLPTREERMDWLGKVRKIVMSASNYSQGYIAEWYKCGEYVAEDLFRVGFNRTDISFPTGSTEVAYNASLILNGRTFFNLPIYKFIVDLHSDCMMLVGDDVRNSSDWCYISSQILQILPMTEYLAHTVDGIGGPVVFAKNGQFLSMKPGLITSRTSEVVRRYDNQNDLWHPRVVNGGNGYLFFEKQNREGMTHYLDVFQTTIPISGTVANYPGDGAIRLPIPGVSPVHYLLDAQREGTTNRIHLLWRAKEPASPPRMGVNGGEVKEPGLFYGVYDLSARTISAVSRITPQLPHGIGEARAIPFGNGNAYVFFSKPRLNAFGGDNEPGLYRCLWNGTQWGPIEKLTSDNSGHFAACGNLNNQVFFAYGSNLYCYSSGSWTGPHVLSTGSTDPSGRVEIRSLVSNGSNLVNIAYLDYYSDPMPNMEHLFHSTALYNGSTWTWGSRSMIEGCSLIWGDEAYPLVPDNPVINIDNAGTMHIIWKRIFRSVPPQELELQHTGLCFSKYSGGAWLPPTKIQWNPGVEKPSYLCLSFNSANKPIVAFQENNPLADNNATVGIRAGRLLNVPADFASLQSAASSLQTGDFLTTASGHTETLGADLVFTANQVTIRIPNGLNLNGRMIRCTGAGSYIDATLYTGISGRTVTKGMDGRIISIR